jgi:putative ABC transport system permease protein
MNVILRLAWRDTRASRRRLLLYSGTIVLGIAALVAVGSFGANLRKTMGDQPKRLLGGDLRVGLSSWPNPAFQAYMDSIGAVEAREKIFNSPLSAPGRDTPRQSVLVLAIGGPFPLYGELTAAPAGAVDRFRRGERVALIDSQVAERYRLKPGDPITLAGAGYTVAGVIGDMPGAAAQMFVLTGQVVVPWSAAVPDVAAGKPPKRGNYRLFFRLPAGADEAAVATEVKNRFPDAFPVIMTSAELGKNIDTALLQTSRFFSLVLFISLFLGAIGVASAFHVYVQERLPTVAILRCLGASVAESIGVYLCQALALGCVGAVGGALVGLAAQRAIPRLVQSFLPVHLEVFLAWKPVLAGMAAGLCISFVFTLLPLLPIRRVSPLSALRSDFSPGPGADPARAVVWGLIAAAVAGFAYWQTRSLPVMLAYTVALAFAFGVFAGAAALLTFAIRRFFPSGAPYVLRQGVANLHRPRNRTLLLLLSLGLGIFLVLTIYLVRSTLLSDFGGEASANVVVSNVPDEDAATVLGLAGSEKMRVLRQIPSLRVSVESVDGKPPVPRRGSRMPEGNLFAATYRDRLLPYEHLVEGSFTGRVQPGSPVVPVTVAMWTTGRGGLFRLGDEVVWNVAGVPVRTRIVGVRRIEGLHLEPNFAVLFPAGALDGAPKETILLLRSPNSAGTARLERSVAAASPKAQVLDLAVLLEAIDRIFSRVALVVDFIAFFTVATGLVILAAAVVAGRHQRARESVLLRSLGATRGQLRWIQLTEYSVLGILSGAVGCGLAAGANALLAHFLLNLPPSGGALDIAVATTAIVAVTVATGVFADRGLSRLSPLEILREET